MRFCCFFIVSGGFFVFYFLDSFFFESFRTKFIFLVGIVGSGFFGVGSVDGEGFVGGSVCEVRLTFYGESVGAGRFDGYYR